MLCNDVRYISLAVLRSDDLVSAVEQQAVHVTTVRLGAGHTNVAGASWFAIHLEHILLVDVVQTDVSGMLDILVVYGSLAQLPISLVLTGLQHL